MHSTPERECLDSANGPRYEGISLDSDLSHELEGSETPGVSGCKLL